MKAQLPHKNTIQLVALATIAAPSTCSRGSFSDAEARQIERPIAASQWNTEAAGTRPRNQNFLPRGSLEARHLPRALHHWCYLLNRKKLVTQLTAVMKRCFAAPSTFSCRPKRRIEVILLIGDSTSAWKRLCYKFNLKRYLINVRLTLHKRFHAKVESTLNQWAKIRSFIVCVIYM